MKLIVTSQDWKLVEALHSSELCRSYEDAFRRATGLALFFRLAHTDQIDLVDKRDEQNSFCKELNSCSDRVCTECQKAHDGLRAKHGGNEHACRGFCLARMIDTTVPVCCGGTTIGWLWTGRVFIEERSKHSWRNMVSFLKETGRCQDEIQSLQKLWEATPEMTDKKYKSVVVLLEAFAKQLSKAANRLIIESRPQEPDSVTKARRYIRENLGDRLTLEEVATHAGLSPHHFCKVFRRAVGVNLIDFINRSRVEHARQMLLKADARVSEVAFEVGYRSLSQFNRSFRTVTGESPTEYRRRILKPDARHSA